MSYFGITEEKIKEIKTHPNADKLQLGSLENCGFQFVVPKDKFKAGDKVLYFMVDSILPDEVATKLGLFGKLSGNQKNRIKTVKLRGEISQGVVEHFSVFEEEYNKAVITAEDLSKFEYSWLNEKMKDCGYEYNQVLSPEKLSQGYYEYYTGENKAKLIGVALCDVLGVTKYEPEEIVCKNANLKALPMGLTKYDIEGAEREVEMFEAMLDVLVEISEKIEGSNASVCKSVENEVFVNQRNHSVHAKENEDDDHTWRKTARKERITDFVDWLKAKVSLDVAVYGELLGPSIQGNHYELKETQIRVFEIKINGIWCNPTERMNFIEQFRKETGIEIKHVPIIASGVTLRSWLNGRSIKDACSGNSALIEKLREGIVVKCCTETRFKNKRLILKVRDPIYLDKYGY